MRIARSLARSLARQTSEPDVDSGRGEGETREGREETDGFICARFRSLELLAFFYLPLSLSLLPLADRAKSLLTNENATSTSHRRRAATKGHRRNNAQNAHVCV